MDIGFFATGSLSKASRAFLVDLVPGTNLAGDEKDVLMDAGLV